MLAESLRDLAVPVDSLTPLAGNPRRGDVAAVARSLRRFGQRKPIVARRDGTVEAGNHTLLAARELGWESIAVVWMDDDEATAKAYALADNRTSALGAFDESDLAAMVGEVFAVDPDLLADASFDGDYLNELLGRSGEPPAALTDPDAVPEPPIEPKTKRGDLWLLGPHRVLCGDCRQQSDLETLMDGRRVNVAFTSPPYAAQRAYDEISGFWPIPPDEYVDWFEHVQAGVRAVLADDGSWFVNINAHADDGERHLYVKDLAIAHVRRWGWLFVDELCWVDAKNGVPGAWPNRFKDAWEPVFHYSAGRQIKFNPLANGTESDAVFDYSPATHKSGTGSGLLGEKATVERTGLARPSNVVTIAASSERGHSAAFPVALPQWFIRAYSDEGDAVLDPFMGSGSTLIAAHREQRIAYGLEISPAYTDVICRRYQEHTGEKPILEGTEEPHDFT